MQAENLQCWFTCLYKTSCIHLLTWDPAKGNPNITPLKRHYRNTAFLNSKYTSTSKMDLSGSEFLPELVFVWTSCCLRKSHSTYCYDVPCLQFHLQNFGKIPRHLTRELKAVIFSVWHITQFYLRPNLPSRLSWAYSCASQSARYAAWADLTKATETITQEKLNLSLTIICYWEWNYCTLKKQNFSCIIKTTLEVQSCQCFCTGEVL